MSSASYPPPSPSPAGGPAGPALGYPAQASAPVSPQAALPGRPTLFSGSTVHGRRGIRQLRHPVEMPLLWIGVVLTVLAYVAWVALVAWLLVDTEPTGTAKEVQDLFVGEQANSEAQLLLALPGLPLLVWVARAFMYGRLRATGVQMSPTQFPEGYRMVVEAAAAFGMRRVPDAYVVLGNGQINAFASGHGFRRFVCVHSDLFEVGGSARDPEALRFVVAHEVGHLAAGHVSFWRVLVNQVVGYVPFLGLALSRSMEYTADNHGYAVAPRGVPGVVGLLGAGKYLGAHVNLHATADRAVREKGAWVHLVNWTATHPPLTWRAHALRDRSRPGRVMIRPKTAWFEAVGPVGYNRTAGWPTPAQVLEHMDRVSPRVVGAEEQFGRYPGLAYPVARDVVRLADPTPVSRPPRQPTGSEPAPEAGKPF